MSTEQKPKPSKSAIIAAIVDAQSKKPKELITGTSNWAAYIAKAIEDIK